MQVLSLIASFTALRQALLGEESEKILKPSALRELRRSLWKDGNGPQSHVESLNILCDAA